jgi:hypothetical protein
MVQATELLIDEFLKDYKGDKNTIKTVMERSL